VLNTRVRCVKELKVMLDTERSQPRRKSLGAEIHVVIISISRVDPDRTKRSQRVAKLIPDQS
jgi:hypothetical protein